MLIAILIAMLPAIVLMIYIFKKDRLEKEPKGLLFKLMLFGALFSFIPAVLEGIGDYILQARFGKASVLYYIVEAFFVVALSEEWFKRMILKRKTWSDPNFNCSFDGIVYAAYVSLGFALLENLLYVFGGSLFDSLSTGLLRAVTAIPAHFFNAVFMGMYYGRAKERQLRGDTAGMNRNMKLSLWVPVCLHGFYDACAFIGGSFLTIVFYIFLIALYIISFRTVKRESAEDRYLIGGFDVEPEQPEQPYRY